MVPKRALLGTLVAFAGASVLIASASTIGAFSSMSATGGSFEDGWTVTTLNDVNPTRFDLVNDDGQVVVKATAENAAASLIRTLRQDLSVEPVLSWRWRIDRVVEKSDIATKQGDDFAARLYVFFDYPAWTACRWSNAPSCAWPAGGTAIMYPQPRSATSGRTASHRARPPGTPTPAAQG